MIVTILVRNTGRNGHDHEIADSGAHGNADPGGRNCFCPRSRRAAPQGADWPTRHRRGAAREAAPQPSRRRMAGTAAGPGASAWRARHGATRHRCTRHGGLKHRAVSRSAVSRSAARHGAAGHGAASNGAARRSVAGRGRPAADSLRRLKNQLPGAGAFAHVARTILVGTGSRRSLPGRGVRHYVILGPGNFALMFFEMLLASFRPA